MTTFLTDLSRGRLNELFFERVIFERKGLKPVLASKELQNKGIDYVVNQTTIEVKSYKSKYNHFCFETLNGLRLGWLFTSKAQYIAFTDYQDKVIHFLNFKEARAQIIINIHKYKQMENQKTKLDKDSQTVVYQSRFIMVSKDDLSQFINTIKI